MPTADIAALRRSLAAIEAGDTGFSEREAPISFGLAEIDEALGGGLAHAALHEVFAGSAADGPAATGFALALMLRAVRPEQKIVWVRQDMAAREGGELYAPGLAEFGADPSAIIQVRVADALSALRAANEALRCCALGAVALDIWAAPKALDLTATRRLARAAALSGTPAFLIRTGAEPVPSAAMSRWRVRTAPSRPLAADAPGFPVFDIALLRHRAGLAPRRFRVEWDRDQCAFRAPALSRAVAAASVHRSAAPAEAPFRRAG
jgi:protein ImuA